MSRLQHRLGRRSNYVRGLQSPEWREVCRRVRLRDGHRCQLCGKTYTLEVHHLTYYDDCGHSIVGHESEHLDKLITLCGDCHQKQHRK
ncbi:HNH endonuclease [Alistipes senegalensis]|uniref:HNH endonuclease n=1 Tax=Alistipes senegalensis TaxID=1288121 RepID=UPI0018A9D85E|nr:HNH endonuclease [Alistipes senegalensis]